MIINLSKVDDILEEVDILTNRLNGLSLDERIGVDSKAEAREEKVQRSRDLQQLAHLLELAATLVRNEYWVARGGADMIYGRKQQ